MASIMTSNIINEQLDNQKKIQEEQDKAIERIRNGVENIKEKANTINIAIEEDTKILVPIEKNIDNTSNKINNLNNKVKKMIDDTDDKYKFCCIGALFIIFIILLFVYISQNS